MSNEPVFVASIKYCKHNVDNKIYHEGKLEKSIKVIRMDSFDEQYYMTARVVKSQSSPFIETARS